MAKILFCITAASAKINARSVRRFLSPACTAARFFIQIACVVGVCTFKHALELLWSVRRTWAKCILHPRQNLSLYRPRQQPNWIWHARRAIQIAAQSPAALVAMMPPPYLLYLPRACRRTAYCYAWRIAAIATSGSVSTTPARLKTNCQFNWARWRVL